MLDDLDLVAALEWQSIEMKNRYGINITFNTNLTASDLSLETSTALFRIYQEALTNVVRHSGASEVNSRLQKMDNEIILTISDNGIGMDLTVKKEHNSFGIIGIKERTFAIGGQFELISRPGEGTTIKIVVPV
jgi:signal transduction histidine kinase